MSCVYPEASDEKTCGVRVADLSIELIDFLKLSLWLLNLGLD